ncbi:MAG: ABC transporter permease [Chlamydiota bacterium]
MRDVLGFGKFGIILLLLIALFAVFVPILSSYNYAEISLTEKNLPPSWEHWFGTDDLGRDMFVRSSYGARISLTIGICAALVDMVIGVIWGGFAGYFGGRLDEVLMRIADILFSLPYVLVATLLMVIMEPGMVTMIVALSLIGWITMARVVRAHILQLREQDYVLASQAFGGSGWWVIRKHLIPNSLTPIICTLTLSVPTAIFTEAFLSFLGLGIQAPMASWGTMASEGLPALAYYPWRVLFPIGCITLTMLAFNSLGDELTKRVQNGQKETIGYSRA